MSAAEDRMEMAQGMRCRWRETELHNDVVVGFNVEDEAHPVVATREFHNGRRQK